MPAVLAGGADPRAVLRAGVRAPAEPAFSRRRRHRSVPVLRRRRRGRRSNWRWPTTISSPAATRSCCCCRRSSPATKAKGDAPRRRRGRAGPVSGHVPAASEAARWRRVARLAQLAPVGAELPAFAPAALSSLARSRPTASPAFSCRLRIRRGTAHREGVERDAQRPAHRGHAADTFAAGREAADGAPPRLPGRRVDHQHSRRGGGRCARLVRPVPEFIPRRAPGAAGHRTA